MQTPSDNVPWHVRRTTFSCWPHHGAIAWVSIVIGLILANSHNSWAQAPRVLQVELSGGALFGMPVHWGHREAALIDEAGKLHIFPQSAVQSHKVLDQAFHPQSLVAARAQLQAELGSDYETFVFGPYVLGAPASQGARWRHRFQTLLAGYSRYFQLRGWQLRTPDFPLVVVVFGDRQEFVSYASTQTKSVPDQVIGSYYPRSNRCVLYQLRNGSATDWNQTEATVVHEAVHQLAYNTGVHERLMDNPRWFVEGLATMFEIPAIYELGVDRTNLAARTHPQKAAYLRPLLATPSQLERHLNELIADDTLFQRQPELAYALGWALTFYLAEKMPAEYQDLIRRQNQRSFGQYPSSERRADFEAALRINTRRLTTKMVEFLNE